MSVLTNALEAAGVPAVHAGCVRWRRALLATGVRLYELQATAVPQPVRDAGLAGSSSSRLRAKLFVLYRNRVFIGSFNFDPLSLRLNTELGFLVRTRRWRRSSPGRSRI